MLILNKDVMILTALSASTVEDRAIGKNYNSHRTLCAGPRLGRIAASAEAG